MDKNYCIEAGENSEQTIQFLEDKIYDYNSSIIKTDDGCLFSKIIRDDNNVIIAGIAGWTWAKVCEITHFWVNENERGNGVGKLLLEAAEIEARKKRSQTILVRSYSFQAPNFYITNGYKIEYQLNNFPIGHSYYILTKNVGG